MITFNKQKTKNVAAKDLRELWRRKEDARFKNNWRQYVGKAKYHLVFQWPQQ